MVTGCALPQPKEKTISNNQYIDPNIPSLDIQFPFNVWLNSEDTVRNQSGDVAITHKLTTLGTSKANTIVYIDKAYMPASNAYWTGVNYEKEQLFYEDKKRNSDGCFVYYKEFSGKHFLVGDIIKYGLQRGLTNIRLSEYFSDIHNYNSLDTKHRDSVDEMIKNTKAVCSQVIGY